MSADKTVTLPTIQESDEIAARPRWRGGSQYTLGTLSVVVFLLIWQITTTMGFVDPILLSSPLEVARAAYEQFVVTGEIYPHILVSGTEAVIGFALAIVVGVFLGLMMGRFESVRKILEPFVMALYSTPSVALLPLFILWLGIGLWSKVLIVFLGGVFAILVNTIAGVRGVNPRLIETAESFTATKTEIFFYIILPASVPFIVAGIRLAIGRVLISVFVAELYAANQGVGYLIMQAGGTYKTPTMLMGILLFTITGMVLSQALSFIETGYLSRFRQQ